MMVVGSASEPRVPLDRAGMIVFRDTTFLAGGPAAELGRSAAEVVLMIEATQKKLREARFFLTHLETENRRAVRNEAGQFGLVGHGHRGSNCCNVRGRRTMPLHIPRPLRAP